MIVVSRGSKPPPSSPLPRLEVFASSLPADAAIMRTTVEGVVMASNKRFSQTLVSDEWESFPGAGYCWTGTMTAYVEPGKSFRESSERIASIDNAHYVVFIDQEVNQRWLFLIPEQYLDKKDSILVVEHPNFSFDSEGNNRIVRAAQVDLVERVPTTPGWLNGRDGWHIGDKKYDIPNGKLVDLSVGAARRLYRLEGKNVGLLARLCLKGNRQYVYANFTPSNKFNVMVHNPIGFDPNHQAGYREASRLLESEPEQNEPEKKK